MVLGGYCEHIVKTTTHECALADDYRYVCYEAVVMIVTNHYRTSNDAEELDARKTLTTALKELSVIEQLKYPDRERER